MTEAQALQLMLDELESAQLHVVLVPLDPNRRNWNEYGCKRVVAERNANWYRDFCRRHLSSRKRNHRKPDTCIRRACIIRKLRRLIKGRSYRGAAYDSELLAIARGRVSGNSP